MNASILGRAACDMSAIHWCIAGGLAVCVAVWKLGFI